MSLLDSSTDTSFEECVDTLDQFIASLNRYPETILASALRVHLGALLNALVEHEQCSRDEVREFLGQLEREALT